MDIDRYHVQIRGYKMQPPIDLVERSLSILRAGQTSTGAFVACPSFPAYQYCWFRDATFIAHALDLWDDHSRAQRFYDWAVRVVLDNRAAVQSALATTIGAIPRTYLHTRYRLDGSPSEDDWPNFQLDGFGTFLWGLVSHLRMTGEEPPEDWLVAVQLLTSYLAHLWQSPSFDCWEEHPDKIHISTLCALYGGLVGVARHFYWGHCQRTADLIRTFVLQHVSPVGHLPKFIGTNVVDASLLWASIPFGMLDPSDPVMIRTVMRIEADLIGPHGGVHRYATDSYYGGGAWLLLTALFGEYLLARGDRARAISALEWIEQQASPMGELPEQVPYDLNDPTMYEPWVKRWGPIACPLLWSHAAYLQLKHALSDHPDSTR
jgi:GH15 family glucan-1,4-alpha-glucosidase